MSSISALIRLRSRYYELQSDVSSVRASLSSVPSYLSRASNILDNNYLIDEIPADYGRIMKEQKDISKILSDLSSCASAISRRIDEITEEIRRLEEEEDDDDEGWWSF